jgi:uncharacterized membrane protein
MSRRWRRLLYGFWFVPGLVVVGLAVLALALIELDARLLPSGVPLLFDGSGSGARSILGTVATAIATTAGVVFSITIVTLQLVSSQFTPRALRGFLEDRVSQLAAGTFVGTFVYCLLVLRVVRDQEATSGTYVPAVAVTGGVVLGVVSLAVLLVFVHHTSTSIQVASIAARTARDVAATVTRLFPEPFGEGQAIDAGSVREQWRAVGDRVDVHASRSGFVQFIEVAGIEGRVPPGTRVELRVRPGDFVVAGRAVAVIFMPPSERGAAEARAAVARAIIIEDERDSAQDVDYGLQRLADIAVRALSPGVNDPGTAVTCIEYVAVVMDVLAGRADPAAVRRLDRDVELLAEPMPFSTYLETAFVAIGREAVRMPSVAETLLRAMTRCAHAAATAGARDRAQALLAAAEDVGRSALQHAELDDDRARLATALARIRQAEIVGPAWDAADELPLRASPVASPARSSDR